MTRIRSLAFAVTAVLFFIALAPLGAIDAQMMGTRSLSGNWHVQATGDVFHKGTLHLTQQGSTIVGSAPMSAGAAQINGTLANDKMSGTWRAPNHETGWLTLNFASNGRGFNGEWGYHGHKPNGSIVGTRATM